MNIYDQVEKLITTQDNQPKWAEEILFELREIKKLLQNMPTPKRHANKDKAYLSFVHTIRKKLRADINNNLYPEIYYQDQILGVNFKGFIYDKQTSHELPAYRAFEVYRFLYDNQENLDKYIKT